MLVTRWGRWTTALPVVALAVALGGCTLGAPMPTPTPTPTPAYTSDYAAPAALTLAPLTGVEVPVGTLTGPSLTAKIDNHPDARPQVGLDRTDLVYEELVEGGYTRYAAVWDSHVPAEIGPIRSIRPMDPDIVSPLGGIIAYSGGQYRFVVLMQSTNVYNAIHGQTSTASVMYRTTKKRAPHNVIVKAPQLIAMHAKLAPPPQQYSYASDPAQATAVVNGPAINNLVLHFTAGTVRSWAWSPAAGAWLRTQDGKRDLDSNGHQLSATNVIVVRVPVTFGLGVPKTELIGSGNAEIATGGHWVKARWSKTSRTSPIRLVDATGTVIRLAPGNSWIELVPNTGSVSAAPAAG